MAETSKKLLNGEGLATVWAQTKSKDDAVLTAAKAYTDQVALEGTVDLSGYATKTEVSSGDSSTLTSAKSYADSKVSTEASARESAVSGLDARLAKTEAFFATASGESIDAALDTLVELQAYIKNEGADADAVLADVTTLKSQMDYLTESEIKTICS